MSKIKHILFFIIPLVLLLSGLQWFVNFGARNSTEDQTGKVNMLLSGSLDPEVICFGSSVGEVGFNSKIVGEKLNKSVYNVSIDGTSFIQYKGLIDAFANSSLNNQLIIFMESYFTFQNPHQVSSLERYIAHIDNPFVYKCLHNQQPELLWKCKFVPWYSFVPVTHVFYKNAVKGWKSYLSHQKGIDTLFGHTPVNREWEADQDAFLASGKKYTVALDSSVISTYIQTIKELKVKNKKVVIVLTPIYVGLEQSKLTSFTALRETFKRVSSETGTPFLDFTSDSLCFSKTNFYNSNHLNAKGAKAFSLMLADRIGKIYE